MKRCEPFFAGLAVVENYPLDPQPAGAYRRLTVTRSSAPEKTHFDVTVAIGSWGTGEIAVELQGRGDGFEETVIDQMGRHFVALLE
jgi:hypothetical protein